MTKAQQLFSGASKLLQTEVEMVRKYNELIYLIGSIHEISSISF